MRSPTSIGILLCGLSLTTSSPHAQEGLPIEHRDSSAIARQRQLVQCLSRGERFDIMRAAEELAVMGTFPGEVRLELLAEIRKSTGETGFRVIRYVDVVAAAGPEAVPDILRE